MHDGFASLGCACDGYSDTVDDQGHALPCPAAAAVIVKMRYQGRVRPLCWDCLCRELGPRALGDAFERETKRPERRRKLADVRPLRSI